LVAITISNVFSVAIPRFIGPTIQRIAESGLDSLSTAYLFRQALIIVGLSIGSGIFLYLTRMSIIVMSRLVERDLRNDFLKHLQSLPMGHFTSTPTGDMMALATNDISAVREFVGPGLMYTANTITTFSFAMAMMLTLSVKITLLALLPLPFVSYSVYWLGKKIHTLFTDVQAQFSDMTSQAQENLSGVRVVRAYVREAYSVSAFANLSMLYKAKNLKLVKTQAIMMPAMMALIGLSQLIVLYVGGLEVIAGRSNVGDITQFYAYIGQLIWPVIAIGWVTNLVQRGAASMVRLNRVFDLPPEIDPKEYHDPSVGTIRGEIEFRNVSFRYDPAMPWALRNINVHIPAGGTLAIIGTTGSGKSTIVGLIARLFETSEGEILIDNVPINQVPIELLRASIGVVSQETFLFSDTLAGNIRFGRRDATNVEVVESAMVAGLDDAIDSFPKGYETVVGERGITLSGGQKQRTAIARAVLRQPEILMLDDALSAVDTETEERILKSLRTLMRERTSILIAHRISTVKDADQIIVMDGGRILERGTHEELLEQRGEYSRIYERQLLEEALETL
jgi:ATP-binding cassette subfamily B protein